MVLGEDSLEGLVKVTAVVEAGKRVPQGEGRDVGVQEGIGQRQRSMPGEQLERLQLDRSEAGGRIHTPHGDRAHDHAVADQRHPGGDGDRHDRLAAD